MRADPTMSDERLAAYVAWAQGTDRYPSHTSADPAERALAQLALQAALLPPDHPTVAHLNAHAPGWNDALYATAMTLARRVILYAETHGSMPRYNRGPAAEKSLGKWLVTQRAVAAGTNTSARRVYPGVQALLDARLPGWRSVRDLNAVLRAREAAAWVAEHGRAPKDRDDDRERSVYKWLLKYRRDVRDWGGVPAANALLTGLLGAEPAGPAGAA